MNFQLTSEQRMLEETVQRFLAQRYDFEARKRIVRSEAGFSREIWASLAEMGLLSLQLPPESGGMAPAAVETLLTMTAMGKALFVEPYLSSAVVATALVRELAPPAQRDALLEPMAAGSRIAVLAHGEAGARHELPRVATAARRDGKGYRLRGRKAVVLHAPAADLLLVSARTAGGEAEERGISIFALGRELPGLRLVPYTTVDGQRAAELELDDVAVPADALVGPEGGAYPALEAAWELGLASLCAEAAGALQAALDATVEYTKTRRQFGQPIAKFQALQHRMADMLIQVEQARSMSYLAAMQLGATDARVRRRALSAAKVLVGQACRRVGQEAVQLHGGMGMSEELAVAHYFRRLMAIELSFGDTDHHLQRFIAEGRGG